MAESLSQAFEKSLSLKDKPAEANAALIDAYPAVNLSAEQKAELYQWLTLSNRFKEEPQTITDLNNTLRGRTYILNTADATVADVAVFTRIADIVKGWSKDEVIANRHIVRWADQVQHVANVPEAHHIKVDLALDAPREQKVKPKKGEDKKKETAGAAAATGAAAGAATGAAAAASAPAEGKPEGKPEGKRGKPSPEEIAKAQKEKAEKKEKKKKAQPAPAQAAPITPGMVDLRVGHIEKAVKHPDADSLYVSTIHMGDAEGPRTVCSGLVKYVPLEDMQGRDVVVVANLKPVTMRGIKSQAMVLCASDEDHGIVEFVNPPPGSKAGDKIFFESYDIDPEPVLNPKKKIWETVQPGFTTTEKLEVIFKKDGEPDRKLVNKKGELCLAKSLVNATVR